MQLLMPLFDELAFNALKSRLQRHVSEESPAWTVAFFDTVVPHNVQNPMTNCITTPRATSRYLRRDFMKLGSKSKLLLLWQALALSWTLSVSQKKILSRALLMRGSAALATAALITPPIRSCA